MDNGNNKESNCPDYSLNSKSFVAKNIYSLERKMHQ